ncbi:fimbria/pilus outer membrane usher protein [Hydrogenophaga laconesensis]|uniref:Outer membrane usher protein FimD/PapC n=1 Tax=Hydrogenophaga laconesensis TaxID=1805971 RepID=A0ABU1VFX8_9BURK|nr:fimbria/pilus outer membrane usher protein [Hydrogenophaga laconesensis]MDR7096376.1 outer membrane usher protein FimD/PapC [Hydrogenophaga laconesensis]
MSATRETLSGVQAPVNRFSIGFTLPLDSQPGRTIQARTFVQHDNVTGTAEQASLSGSFGAENRAGWGLYTAHTREGTNSSASINYQAPLAQLGANISSGGGYKSLGISASGGMVAHGGGLTLAPYLGETIGLVKVENGQDVRILGAQAATVDSRGYTVIPHLLPYQLNNVELDFSQASLDTQVDNTNLQAAPRARAVAAFNFTVPAGRVILIKTVLEDGSPAPFGATVINEKGEQVGAVGQAGKAEARITENAGQLTVKWGEGAGQQCSMPYTSQPPGDAKADKAAPAYQPMPTSRCIARTMMAPQRAGEKSVS